MSQATNLSSDVRQIFDACSSAVIVLDTRGTILFSNRGIESLFAYDQAEIVGQNVSILVPENLRAKHDAFVAAFQRAASSRSMGSGMSFPARKKNGENLYVSIGLRPLNLHGKTFTVATITEANLLNQLSDSLRESEQDLQTSISENLQLKAKAEHAQLKENNEVLETTAKIAKLGFYSLDTRSGELTWSKEVFKIHDLPEDHLITVDEAFTYYAPAARPIIEEAVAKCLEKEEAFDLELPFTTAKAREIWVRVMGYVQYEDGEPVILKGAFQDITHMREAAIRANQAMRTKSAFLANMSHELRTPITGIMGLSDLLEESPLNDSQKRYMGMIKQSARSLLGLVNQVLDYSKLEANKEVLRPQVFVLRHTIEEVLAIHRVEAKRKGLRLALEMGENVPRTLINDKERFQQILHNLCGNALKFTARGSVVLKVSSDENNIRFSVIDSGIGIEAKDTEGLFTEFQQIDSSFSRSHGGTGLGLSIVKHLTELMGGEVGLESQFGSGSCFWFKLPQVDKLPDTPEFIRSDVDESLPNSLIFVSSHQEQAIFEELARMQGLRALVVSRHSDLLTHLREDKIWKLIGIFHAPNDVRLDTFFASIQRLQKSDQLLCVAESLASKVRKLKQLSGKQLNFHIIKQAQEKSRELDHQLHLQDMLARHQRLLLDKEQELKHKRILLAEDNEINQVVGKDMLKSMGIDVVLAENGEAVLAILKTDSDFDLILMDCQMPKLDGYDTAKAIKAHPDKKIRDLCIIAATAHGFQDDIQRCYDLGMRDVLLKPFTRQDLFDMLNRHL